MINNISKELFEAVTKIKTDDVDLYIDINSIRYWTCEENRARELNINSFFMQSLQFCYDNGYSVFFGIDDIGNSICYYSSIIGYARDYYIDQWDCISSDDGISQQPLFDVCNIIINKKANKCK